MLELPEAQTVARQLNETIRGKKIANIVVNQSPHKFAFFCENPENYAGLLIGKIIGEAHGYGGMVEISADNAVVLLGDGVGIRFHEGEKDYPKKHQLLIEFEDSSALSVSTQMYGGIWCFSNGEFDNIYYKAAKEKISPMSVEFDRYYFMGLINSPEVQKISSKAFLATEQRIPGLGNGVLQDILWYSQIHPKRKINSLSEEEKVRMFESVKYILSEMVRLGGRDTEKDLFGNDGGYVTRMSKKCVSLPCVKCGGFVRKENYMGGSIYYCEECQKL